MYKNKAQLGCPLDMKKSMFFIQSGISDFFVYKCDKKRAGQIIPPPLPPLGMIKVNFTLIGLALKRILIIMINICYFFS